MMAKGQQNCILSHAEAFCGEKLELFAERKNDIKKGFNLRKF
jgi:hypothetical protein